MSGYSDPDFVEAFRQDVVDAVEHLKELGATDVIVVAFTRNPDAQSNSSSHIGCSYFQVEHQTLSHMVAMSESAIDLLTEQYKRIYQTKVVAESFVMALKEYTPPSEIKGTASSMDEFDNVFPLGVFNFGAN